MCNSLSLALSYPDELLHTYNISGTSYVSAFGRDDLNGLLTNFQPLLLLHAPAWNRFLANSCLGNS